MSVQKLEVRLHFSSERDCRVGLLSVAGEGRNPRRCDLLRLAEQVDIRVPDASAIIDQVRGGIEGFSELAEKAAVSKRTASMLRSRFRELCA